ncbi:MAG: tetratricopeptide repeat protein [Kofleriaceae bacterium]|nr:tetratricopeptide repeat protein [Kofleriaceae bacterium]
MEQFGKYQMLRRVGVGGMAEVYLARTTVAQGLSKQLVIKKIHPAYARSTQFLSMFVEEAKIALSLNHPNIVQVFDFGQVGQTFFLAMEFIEGLDILRIQKELKAQGNTVPLDIAAFVMQEAVKGLDYAHRKADDFGDSLEIVHRDISPQNLLISWDGAVKIVDFGIAKAQDTKEEEGVIKGKFAYMPPEQARGESVDRRADIFSAGVVLFELACGRPLYQGKGKKALEEARQGAIPSPRSLNPDIPPELENTILKALAYNREDRFDTARDFQHALGKFQFRWAQDHGEIPIESGGLAQWLSRNVRRTSATETIRKPLTPSAQSSDSLALDTKGVSEVTQELIGQKESRERKPVFVIQGWLTGQEQLEARIGRSSAQKLVNDFFQIARDIAFKHDASTQRNSNGSLRIVVGVPAAGEDDASRTIVLALALVEALDGIGHDVEPDLRLAVGIERGTALVSRNKKGRYSHSLEDPDAAAATALSHEALGAELLVTSEVFRVCQNEWNFEPLGATGVGSSKIYRLRGIKERSQRLRERSAVVNMAGRRLELKALRDAYRECLVDRAHKIIVVTADAGMGKRTLLNAFIQTIPEGEASIIRSAARPSMRHTPFGIIADFGRDTLGLAETAAPVEIRKRITMLLELLTQKDPDSREFLELVDAACMLFGVQSTHSAPPEPRLLRSRLRTLSLILERKFKPNKPLVVIAENVHWADEESLRLARELFASGSTRGTLVLISSRPESRIIQLAHDENADLMRLPELDPAQQQAMIEGRFLPEQDIRDLVRQILSRTGGNPFFINEVIDSLLDQGVLAKVGTDSDPPLLRWVRSNAPIQIPTTVEALLATRIDQLPPETKQCLLRSSILGMRFRESELKNLSDDQDLSELRTLADRGLLSAEAGGFSFPNDMTMTVAYRMVPAEDRKDMHKRAAANLSASIAYRPGQDDAKIARHLELAGENEASANQYLSAATHAIRVGSLPDAFYQLGRALKLWRSDNHKQRFNAHLMREEVLHTQVKRPQQLLEIGRLRAEAKALNVPDKLAIAHARHAQYHIACSEFGDAETCADLSLKYATTAKDSIAKAEALRLRAIIQRRQGKNQDALATAELALSNLESHTEALRERAAVLNEQGTILWNMNQLNGAIESYAESLVIYQNLCQPRQESNALNNMGIVFCALGEYEAGLAHYKSALSITQKMGDRVQVSVRLGNIGQTYAELGDYDRAEKYLLKSLKLSEDHNDWETLLDVLNSLGQVYLGKQQLDKARASLDRALEISLESRNHYQEIRALVYLGQVCLEQNLFPEALEFSERAVELARQLPMPVGEMFGLAVGALAKAKLGSPDEGLELSREALRQLDSIEQSEGLEVILHIHSKLCEANNQLEGARQAISRSYKEAQRKAACLQNEQLKNSYRSSPSVRAIYIDYERLNKSG